MVLPSALIFVGVVSLLTLVFLDRFNMQRMATYAWFVVYFVPTALLLYLVWNYRQLFATGRKPLQHPWPTLLLIEVVLLLLYGGALIIAPEAATSFWPWTIDAFHARMYSAFFLTLGVGALVVARGCEKLDILTLGIAQTVTSVSVIGGFIVTDFAFQLAGGEYLVVDRSLPSDWAGWGDAHGC